MSPCLLLFFGFFAFLADLSDEEVSGRDSSFAKSHLRKQARLSRTEETMAHTFPRSLIFEFFASVCNVSIDAHPAERGDISTSCSSLSSSSPSVLAPSV